MPDDDGVKKIINNGVFIAHLAPLLGTEEGDALAQAAQAYAGILAGFGIKADVSKFQGCDQAQKLVAWLKDGGDLSEESVALIEQWTSDILDAIADLAAGKMP